MVAIKVMYKQAGILHAVSDGIVQRGTIIRLLALPNGLFATQQGLMWIACELSAELAICLMAQYNPVGGAYEKTLLGWGVTQKAYDQAEPIMGRLGFENGYVQLLSCRSDWTPDFPDL